MTTSPRDEAAAVRAGLALDLEARFDALRATGRNDPAYCVAHAAAFVLGDAAAPRLHQFAEQYRPPRPRRVVTPLDDAASLSHLHHPDDDPYVGKVFEAVLGAVRKVRARPLESFGLTATGASPATASAAVVRALSAASSSLGVPFPLVFLRPGQPGGLGHVRSEPIATIVGAALLSGRTLEQLAFAAGHHMVIYRADHYARALCESVPELLSLFLAALRVGKPDLEVPAGVAPVAAALEKLLRTDAAARERLARVTTLFLERVGQPDLARWSDGVERTALRAGLLLCGDLPTARQLVETLGSAPADALADLVAFAMSEDYFALRQHTGIAFWPDDPGLAATETAPPAPAAPFSLIPAAMPEPGTAASAAIEIPRNDSPGDWSSIDIPIELDLGTESEAASIASPQPPDAVDSASALPPEEPTIAARFTRAVAERRNEHAEALARVWIRREPEGAWGPAREWLAALGLEASPGALPGVLRESEWNALVDPSERGPVGDALALIGDALRTAVARSPDAYGFDAVTGQAPAGAWTDALERAAYVLDVISPYFFVAADLGAALSSPPCAPPATIADAALPSLAAASELQFLAAEHLAFLRPAAQARVLVPAAGVLARTLRALALAAAAPSVEPTGDPIADATLAALDRATAPAARVALAALPADASLDAAVRDWCIAVEMTAARAALVLAFDFDAAVSALARDHRPASLVAPDAKLRALEEFALSSAFAELRAHIAPARHAPS